ncbi:trifunctional transcriptional regulator/proline dehydrogenase/L-glutamate gamma-semialdehyde dehydrogenase, partial [Acidocella sp.]|uniref:trifunctional transcriptional regulator/proline dehydrogenase/L-glutamate gamma-semialdehyde dehydrogenase n=1 Tax=Acidocella sp. TaxID=50710 RepID=UPI002627004E
MAASTFGVKIDEPLRDRLKAAAAREGQTMHGLVKQAILEALARSEGAGPARADTGLPFFDFAQDVQPQTVLRAAITAAYRRPEPECLPALLAEAALPPAAAGAARALAENLTVALRGKPARGLVEGLLQEYALSSQEGVALMCLAEALLRIPDRATRDALIRDKIGQGHWESHLGGSRSVFVHAATWGLLLTGRLVGTASETGLSAALTRLIARGGEPVIHQGLHIAMRLMGEQFVIGQTIGEALANSRKLEARGFRHSYDMLGEAALTAGDAARYLRDYEQAIHAIGKHARRRGIYEGPGLSIKLSALHPRYGRAQRGRVMEELLPRLTGLMELARHYDIGVNIDAEEADRLELSLDLLEALCWDARLEGWNGIGFVVQAYQKRAPFVLDHLIDLARRSRHRLMVRLVKGAYWDSEIKRAQQDGLEGFPVFTRKPHTDVSYLACARRLLAAPDAVFPQFATHNAVTLAAIHAMAGGNFYAGQYEFQCLHGMGEPLYDEVVGPQKLGRPCRIYAPVGTHETLLPYLVRRLLENGANTSFVKQLADPHVDLAALLADPVAAARRLEPCGAPHPRIALPRDIFGGERPNSAGLDLTNEQRLASLALASLASLEEGWRAAPLLRRETGWEADKARPVRNPALSGDEVGRVIEAGPEELAAALAAAGEAAPIWQSTPPEERAAALRRAADLLEGRQPHLAALIVREAGKGFAAAIGEVREAVDFLRYYAHEAQAGFDNLTHRPLGVVAAISPWNFPLSIFIGQVAGALAAGNAVIAKPAEETPLIAAQAARLLHEAGVPRGALQLLPGDGAMGAALVADPRVGGVVFTGSTEAARAIQRSLALRLDERGHPVPLIAETGGQNAMIIDSSALLEQAVADIIASGFDSAGQRCSALRVLIVQEEIAGRLTEMLHGAMRELRVGRPDRLDTDIGPVISAEARDGIEAHIAAMAGRGYPVFRASLSPDCEAGHFVAPALIEIPDPGVLGREVFGPVIHMLRCPRRGFAPMIEAVNALGYGLTFGIHSRVDETISQAAERIRAGNIYVNRNIIGAVVGVQPFGGQGLSGTGPKAGGPLYLRRLIATRPPSGLRGEAGPGLAPLVQALRAAGEAEAAEAAAAIGAASPLGYRTELPGPVGEQNIYQLKPRGEVLCVAASEAGAFRQIAASLATGNRP